MEVTTVVRRPREYAYLLTRLAREAGMEPREFVIEGLKEHGGQQAFADAISVNRATVYNWRKRFGIVLVDEDDDDEPLAPYRPQRA